MDDTATIQVRTTPTASGTFSATATVDPANAISERSETNNNASVSATVNPTLLPDLTVTSFGGTTFATAGGQATYTATFKNTGSAPANNVDVGFATGSYDWTLVSSSGSSAFTPCQSGSGELSLGVLCPANGHIANLAPGQSVTVTIVVQIPAGTPPGTYWTVAGADNYNRIRETNETNNLTARFPTQVI
jgi:subtilase family serine protease